MRTRSALRAFGLLLLLLLGGCPVPPIVFHDGLPAVATAPDNADIRLGAQAINWNTGSYGHGYPNPQLVIFPSYHIGARVGQQAGPFCFEEGVNWLYSLGFVPFFTGGIGLRDPAVMLRGAVSPIPLGSNGLFWQASLVAGTQRPEHGFGFSAGPRASNLGIGGAVIGDWATGNSLVRAEFSYTARAPWADSAVSGNITTFGLWYEHRFRPRDQRATQ